MCCCNKHDDDRKFFREEELAHQNDKGEIVGGKTILRINNIKP